MYNHDRPMSLLVSFVATTICISNVLSGAVGPPRVLYTMAKDGLLFSSFGRICDYSFKYNTYVYINSTPRKSLIVATLVSQPKYFHCPFTPILPMIALWVNTFMISSMGIPTLVSAGSVGGIAALYYYLIHGEV